MSGYIELWAEYKKKTTSTGVTAIRAFIQKAGGTASLPVIGLALPGAEACLLRDIEESNYHWEIESNVKVSKKKYICQYSTQESGATTHFPTDSDARTFSAGMQSYESWNDTWFWSSDKQIMLTSLRFVEAPCGTFTRSIMFNSNAAKSSWLAGPFIAAVGRINEKPWEDFTIGTVKFTGLSGSNTQTDTVGRKTWVFQLTFEWRVLVDQRPVITQDHWRYVLRAGYEAKVGYIWDMPYTTADGDPDNTDRIYSPGYCDFDKVLFSKGDRPETETETE